MGSLHGFTFEKGLKEMFSQIRKSVGRVPRVRKRKFRLDPFNISLHSCMYSIQGMVEWGRVVAMTHE